MSIPTRKNVAIIMWFIETAAVTGESQPGSLGGRGRALRVALVANAVRR